jgi:hypothetical protein
MKLLARKGSQVVAVDMKSHGASTAHMRRGSAPPAVAQQRRYDALRMVRFSAWKEIQQRPANRVAL